MASRYSSLSRGELARLVPELLLIGHLIDRAGMPWSIAEFGREVMQDIAIEEWAGASPIYTARMQRAMRFEGDDVPTIFKGLQLDIGAPPQFLDFEFSLEDARHGEFRLRHCGALADVEPMGEEFVVGMCHDIEDPTFDATAVATNPRAQVRPIHRPPRVPADRTPVCAWTVVIDDSHPAVEPLPAFHAMGRTHAASLMLDDIDPGDEGAGDYSGPLRAAFDFEGASRSALVRLADEVCVQMHLLSLSFGRAVQARTTPQKASEILDKALVGIAGIASERLATCLDVTRDLDGARHVLELHPLFNPVGYVSAEFVDDAVRVRRSVAHDDGAWISRCGPDRVGPLQAAVRGVDPTLDVRASGTTDDWTFELVEMGDVAPEPREVSVVRVSTGVEFAFEDRPSPVEIRRVARP